MEPTEPMRRWKVRFMGKVRRVTSEAADDGDDDELDVEFLGEWSSEDAVFNYDTDMDAGATARAFAREVWNEQYFQDLEK